MTLGQREAVLLLARVLDNNNGRGATTGRVTMTAHVMSACPSVRRYTHGSDNTEPILLTVLRLAELAEKRERGREKMRRFCYT